MPGKFLFVAQDPGGFNALQPVIAKMRQSRRYVTKTLLAGASRVLVNQTNFPFFDCSEFSETRLEKEINTFSPDVLVTGTSGGNSPEKTAIKIAKKYHIPTVAVLDFWINYNIRFSFDNSSKISSEALPDYILIMDETAKREMIKEGFPRDRLVITGNPHFDTFSKLSNSGQRQMILFVDQPIAESIQAGWHENYGYTELEVFQDLLESLTQLQFTAEVLVRVHPRRQDLAGYKKLAENFSLKVRFDRNKSHDRSLKETRLIFGMTSILLFEAALSGKPVLSYQPGLKKTDPLIANRLGLSHFVYKKSHLTKKLASLLKKKGTQSRLKQKYIDYYTKNRATDRVLKFITTLAKNEN